MVNTGRQGGTYFPQALVLYLKALVLYLKRPWECQHYADVSGRFGYSGLKEAARPEGAGMGFLCGRFYVREFWEVFTPRCRSGRLRVRWVASSEEHSEHGVKTV